MNDFRVASVQRMLFRQELYFFGFLAYLAVLPIASTVALRYLLLLGLLGLIAFELMLKKTLLAHSWCVLPLVPGGLLLLWAAYLLLFPLWAAQPTVAWENLRGQWGVALLAWMIGVAGVLLLGRRGPSLWQLGLASAFLVALHLFIILLAWSGLLGGKVLVDMPLREMLSNLQSVLSGSDPWMWQAFPWGFRGFDPMHGNLGYTADQAIILFMCCLLFAALERRSVMAGWAGLAVVICFMSVVIAYSRGAVLYGLVMILLASSVFCLRFHWRTIDGQIASRTKGRRGQFVLMFVMLAALGLAAMFSFSKDERWHQMSDKVRIAFMIEDPVRFLCEGPDKATLDGMRTRMADREPDYVEALIEGLNGDGARITLMRAGWRLVQEHPLGLDGSRLTYKKLIEAKCGYVPTMVYEHAHQGWLDTALALGWVGGLLLLVLLLGMAWYGWRHLRHPSAGPWAMALFLLAVFWLFRGFADSIYREHLLQMQAALLGYVCARLSLELRQDTSANAAV